MGETTAGDVRGTCTVCQQSTAAAMGNSCGRGAACPNWHAARQAAQEAAQAAFNAAYITAYGIAERVGVTRSSVTWAYKNGKLPLPVTLESVIAWPRTPELEAAIARWASIQRLRSEQRAASFA